MVGTTAKTSNSSTPATHADDWHMHWKGIGGAKQPMRGGATDPSIAEFWERVFTAELSLDGDRRVLDLACGDGAVTGIALNTSRKLGNTAMASYCLDISRFAVLETRKHFPDAMGVSADAGKMPFTSEAFDVVASQFGLEYAQPGAIHEVCRTIANNGLLACLIHKRNGSIYKECQGELEATRQLRNSEILELANNHFGAAVQLHSGSGQRTKFEETGRLLAPAVQRVESMIRTRGKHAAGGLIYFIYQELAVMNDHLRELTSASMEAWMSKMTGELEAYNGRMASMLKAALSEQDLRALIDKLAGEGLIVESSGMLRRKSNQEAMAWTLVCRKVQET